MTTIQDTATQTNELMQRAANLQRGGRGQQAAETLQQVIRIDPTHYQALCVLAQMALAAGHSDAGLHFASRANQSNPEGFESLALLAELFSQTGQTDNALGAMQRAALAQPENDRVFYNIGVLQEKVGHPADARGAYQQALSLNADNIDALSNLAMLLLADENTDAATACFDQLQRAKRGDQQMLATNGTLPSLPESESLSSRFKLSMDLEQLRYLKDVGKLPDFVEPLLQALPRALEDLAGEAEDNDTFRRQHPKHHWKTHWQLINQFHNRTIHLPRPKSGDVPLINPNLDTDALQKAYFDGQPQIVVVDNFLTEDALARLRQFCREATIWHDLRRNYVGAYLTDGFANSLTLGIAQQLRRALPAIFDKHPLTQAWGYKYGAALNGIAMHADAAAVNCNFWITEDEANLDSEHGGLLVYGKEAPLDWDFDKFNNDTAAMHAHLGDSLNNPVRIPHKANRLVIFNSNLFHRTDDIQFKDDFMSRRYNVTLLYGRRG